MTDDDDDPENFNIDMAELDAIEELGIEFGKRLYLKTVNTGTDLLGFELPPGADQAQFQKRLKFQVLVAAAQYIVEVAENLVAIERESRSPEEQIEFDRRRAAMEANIRYEPGDTVATTPDKAEEEKKWN